MRKLIVFGLLALSTLLSGCGYNTLQREDEAIKSAWSEVLNQYQRRFDLIPNLVNTVKGFAEQEKDVLLGVANARSSVGAIKATPLRVEKLARSQLGMRTTTPAITQYVTERAPVQAEGSGR